MPKLASPARSAVDYPMTQADAEAHRKASHVRTARVDMSNLDGALVRETAEAGGKLELHDSTRPDVAPIVLDDFLMAVMRGEVQ
ncbi:hypothetical protein OG784_12910 [Streptomyces sp. NBC_01617]|uniref:hypothetical protein n=1 Tax=Streptomyces sp. NBC_01617 TaxID=2975899 RepID=UPI00386D6D66|nr:hypothetical protein OG784_12910 [Streptomyces sp. NBC_01617]